MSHGSSQVSSGNIVPKVMGPQRDAKEAMLLGGFVLFVAGTLATIWFVSQPKDQGKATGTIEQANVQDLFKKATTRNIWPFQLSLPHPLILPKPASPHHPG